MAGFGDIVGHEQIIWHLRNAIRMGKVSHAYLLNRGTGQRQNCWRIVFCHDAAVRSRGLTHAWNVIPASRR